MKIKFEIDKKSSKIKFKNQFHELDISKIKCRSTRGKYGNPLFLSDELGYLVDAIVNEDKIDSFDSRPNNMSLEVNAINNSTNKYLPNCYMTLITPNYQLITNLLIFQDKHF